MGKLFGTDGLRGVVGVFPLDNATVELLGCMLYFYLHDRNLKPELILGRDTRDSGPALLAALSRGFDRAGGKLHDAGILPTPALAFLARRESKCAISVTASHNPYPDNGIKIFGSDGRKISEEDELSFEKILLGDEKLARTFELSGSSEPVRMQQYYSDEYCNYLTQELFHGLDLSGWKIAVDCANGANYEIAPRVLRQLGADVTAFANSPDGKNINDNCGALYPETLLHQVRSGDFYCGFTFDGDGDRCLVADRDKIYDGDFILAAAASYLQSRGTLNKNKVVATTMSNLGLELFLKRRAIELLRVPVGDKNVLEKLESENLSLGGEQSGHIIFMNDTFIGDGLITALQLLRISKAQNASLAELSKDFEKCPQILLNVPVQRKPELSSIGEVRDGIDRIEQELNGTGRIVVRYSGTEMLARIMIEGKDQHYIEAAAKSLGEIISRNLS